MTFVGSLLKWSYEISTHLLSILSISACDCPKDLFIFPNQTQIEQLVDSGASDAQIQAKFPNLTATDLHILETRVSLLQGQRELVEHLTVLSSDVSAALSKVKV